MFPAALAFFAVLSVVLCVIDLRHHRLPHVVVLPGLVVALTLLTSAGAPGNLSGVWAGAASAFLVGLALHLARPAAFGGGDATLAALAGAHLGWFGGDAVIAGLATGFLCGGAAGLGALLAGGRRTEFALGPSLLLGTWWVLATVAT